MNYTPLFEAQNAPRYKRQAMIRDYEETYNCNLVVMVDHVTASSVTMLSECLHDVDADKDLHLLLRSLGGDPEAAIRLIRMCQDATDKKFVVVVPEMAKSAATIMSLGAHQIIMGPTSDLGPIDPQVLAGDRGYVSAKDLIAAVESVLNDIQMNPNTMQVHAAMLGGIDATMVQFARSALDRTGDIALQAVQSNPDLTEEEVTERCDKIKGPLIDSPKMHAAVIGAREAEAAGLPVKRLTGSDAQWKAIQGLWARYFVLGNSDKMLAYEGRKASQVFVLQ